MTLFGRIRHVEAPLPDEAIACESSGDCPATLRARHEQEIEDARRRIESIEDDTHALQQLRKPPSEFK